MVDEELTEAKVARIPNCDFCDEEGQPQEAQYDGATSHGPWAFMCERHFHLWGKGLGTGKGQKLVLVTGE